MLKARTNVTEIKRVATNYLRTHASLGEKENKILELWSMNGKIIDGADSFDSRVVFVYILQSLDCNKPEDFSTYIKILQQAVISYPDVFEKVFNCKIKKDDVNVFTTFLDKLLQELPKDNLESNQKIINSYIDQFGVDEFKKSLRKYKLTSEQYVWLMVNTMQGRLADGTLSFKNVTAIFELWLPQEPLSAEVIEPLFRTCLQYGFPVADVITLLIVNQALHLVNKQNENSLIPYIYNILKRTKIDELIDSIKPDADKDTDFSTICAYIVGWIKTYGAINTNRQWLEFLPRFSRLKNLIEKVTNLQNDIVENLIPTQEQWYEEAKEFCNRELYVDNAQHLQYKGIVESVANGIERIKESTSIEDVKALVITIIDYLSYKYGHLLIDKNIIADINHAKDFIKVIEDYFQSDSGTKRTSEGNNFLLVKILKNSYKLYKHYQKHTLEIFKARHQKAVESAQNNLLSGLTLKDFVENIIPKFTFDLLQTGGLRIVDYDVNLIAKIRMFLLKSRAEITNSLALYMLPYIEEMLESFYSYKNYDQDYLIQELNKTQFSKKYIFHISNKSEDGRYILTRNDNKCSYYHSSQLERAISDIRGGKVLRVNPGDFKREIIPKLAFDLLENEILDANTYDEYLLARIAIYISEEYLKYKEDKEDEKIMLHYLVELIRNKYVKLIKEDELISELTGFKDDESIDESTKGKLKEEAKEKYARIEDERKKLTNISLIKALHSSSSSAYKFVKRFIYHFRKVDDEIKKTPGFKLGAFNKCSYIQLHPVQRFLETQVFQKKGRLIYYSWGNNYLQKKYATTAQMSSHEKEDWAACVITLDGEILLNEHKGSDFNHARFVAGSSVAFSGEMQIDQFGYLVGLTAFSGHYKSNLIDLYNAIRILQEKGIDTSRCKIYVRNESKISELEEQKNEVSKYLEFFEEFHLDYNYAVKKAELMHNLNNFSLLLKDRLKNVNWDYVEKESVLQHAEDETNQIITRQMIEELNKKIRNVYNKYIDDDTLNVLPLLHELRKEIAPLFVKSPYIITLELNQEAFEQRLESCSVSTTDQFLKTIENYNSLIADQLNQLVNYIDQTLKGIPSETAKKWGIIQLQQCLKEVLTSYRKDTSINLIRVLNHEFDMRNADTLKDKFAPIIELAAPISKEKLDQVANKCAIEKIDLKTADVDTLRNVFGSKLASETTLELVRELSISKDKSISSKICDIRCHLLQAINNLQLLSLDVKPDFMGTHAHDEANPYGIAISV